MVINFRILQLPAGVDYKYTPWEQAKAMDVNAHDYITMYKGTTQAVVPEDFMYYEFGMETKGWYQSRKERDEQILAEIIDNIISMVDNLHGDLTVSVSDVIMLTIRGSYYPFYIDNDGSHQLKKFWR